MLYPLSYLAPVKQKLRRYVARRMKLPETGAALDRVKERGFAPGLIFDVGAYQGDFARSCVLRWPGTKIICFEPQPHKVDELRLFARGTSSEIIVFPVLLGARTCESVLLNEEESASSVLPEKAGPEHKRSWYPMTTVDQVVKNKLRGQKPDMIKIDVQGYELEVLKGAEASLDKVEMILMEVNLLDLHEGVPLMAEVVAWLDERGFVAYDVCGLIRRPLDDALWQVDMIFVPRDSGLRGDKRWQA